MSKRITITLTDDEYAFLEQRAQADRRSVRDMAARLVTQTAPIFSIPTLTPYTQPWNPLWPPAITSGSTTLPNTSTCTTWNTLTSNLATDDA